MSADRASVQSAMGHASAPVASESEHTEQNGSRRSRVLREIGWLAAIAGMSLADGFGFYVTIQRLIRTDTSGYTSWTLVLGASAVAVALPSVMGYAWATLKHGRTGGWLPFLGATPPWIALGVTMVVARLTTAPSATQHQSTGLNIQSSTSLYESQLTAALFLLLFLSTGILAMIHASALTRRSIETHRKELFEDYQASRTSSRTTGTPERTGA